MSDRLVPKAEAKPSTKSDLVARQVTNHVLGCRCPRCMEVRTGFDIGYASGMSNGVASGRALAAADIREYAERLRVSSWNPHTGVALGAIVDEAARIAEGSDGIGTDRDEAALPASSSGPIHGATSTGGSTS